MADYGLGPTTAMNTTIESLKGLDPILLEGLQKSMISDGNQGAMDFISQNPDAFGGVDFSGFAAGSLGTDGGAGSGLLGGLNNMLGTNMSGMDALKGGMGLGQLGLGVLSYMDQKKTAGKQRELMNQQIGQNKFLLDQAKGRQADISKHFGGGGLASSVK